jgi:hypothetical protein
MCICPLGLIESICLATSVVTPHSLGNSTTHIVLCVLIDLLLQEDEFAICLPRVCSTNRTSSLNGDTSHAK